jgi:heptose I phosphotransferase
MLMNLIALLSLATLAAMLIRLGRVPPGGYLEIHPHHAGWLRALGLHTAEDFLALQGLIVCGHPDRNVARLELRAGDTPVTVYLKREHRVPWRVRLAGWWSGLGWCSRSVREARVLQALEREGFPAPPWLAAGETSSGQAFLLLLEVPRARELRAILPGCSPAERRRRFVQLARALARLHTCGLVHPDLYASHVLIETQGDQLVFLDWARCRRRAVVSLRERARALAALDATLPAGEASQLERLLGLRAYLRAACPDLHPSQHRKLLAILDRYRRQFARRRHVVEKSQPRLEPGRQNWTWIDGEELCVTSTLGEVFPDRGPGWLSLRRPSPAGVRWPVSPGGEALRLERGEHEGLALSRLIGWLRGRRVTAPEQRRAHLLLRLERYRITVPRVLAMGQRWQSPGRVESFLLTRPLAGTLSLGHWLARSPTSPERTGVLRAAGEMVRRLHAAGCYLESADAWGDVAVQMGEAAPAVVLQRVDGLSVRRGFDERRAEADVRGCQVLLARQGCVEAECQAFLTAYHEAGTRTTLPATATPGPSGDATMTEPAPLESRQSPPRAGFWQRLRRGVRRLWQRAEWLRYIGADWPSTIMDTPVTDRYSAKQGRSTGRLIVPPQEGQPDTEPLRVYLKRHYHLPWWDRLMALLWPGGGWSPALQELHHLEKARRLGVPVPEVVAAGEFIGPGLRLQSFLAVRELTGMLALHEAIPLAARRMDPDTFLAWKQGLIQEMARLTRLLHDRHWFHKDLYLCHFYIDEAHTYAAPENWRDRVVMIDLHRLGHHPWTWAMWQMKDLAQLLYSSEVEGVTDRDRLAFWRAYQGPGPRRWWEGWLRWFVMLKWKRYRAHNLRHAARRAAAPAVQQPGTAPVATEDRS